MSHSGFLGLRSLLFNVGWYVGSTVIAIVGMPLLLAPRRWVVAWSHFWIRFCLGWLRITCRLTHRLGGLENMPAGPVIIACQASVDVGDAGLRAAVSRMPRSS